MLADTDDAIRLEAVQTILKYRQHSSMEDAKSLPDNEVFDSDDDDSDPNEEIDATNQEVRFFKVPKLNFEASTNKLEQP